MKILTRDWTDKSGGFRRLRLNLPPGDVHKPHSKKVLSTFPKQVLEAGVRSRGQEASASHAADSSSAALGYFGLRPMDMVADLLNIF